MTDDKWNVNAQSDGQVEYTWKEYKVKKVEDGSWVAFHRESAIALWDDPLPAMNYCELLDLRFTDQ